MKIVIDNIFDHEVVPHPLLLIRGRVENFDSSSVLQGQEDAQLFVTCSSASGASLWHQKVQAKPQQGKTSVRFKLLVQLSLGRNQMSLEFFRIRRNITVIFSPPTEPTHFVKILYIVCSDSDGHFQAPLRAGWAPSAEAALKRISIASALIQSVLADSLEMHGFGRKTISFWGSDRSGKSRPDPGQEQEVQSLPEVFVFKSDLTTKEAHSMSQCELWEHHAKEIVHAEETNGVNQLKYFAIHSATRYFNPNKDRPRNHAEVLARTRGHVALGGGDFALIGSGCLYTWPEELSEVCSAFADPSPVDSVNFMDDSAFRGTRGGCFATTLGSAIHELGHMLDLGHSPHGFMARGFDDLHRLFGVQNDVGDGNPSNVQQLLRRDQLPRCGRSCRTRSGRSDKGDQSEESSGPGTAKTLQKTFSIEEGPSLTTTRGTGYLEEYQKKKYYRKMMQECGNAYWDKSSALILSHHRWLNLGQVDSRPSLVSKDLLQLSGGITYDEVTGELSSPGSDLVVVEFRDPQGQVMDFLDLSEASARSFNLLDDPPSFTEANEVQTAVIVCVNKAGHILKRDFVCGCQSY